MNSRHGGRLAVALVVPCIALWLIGSARLAKVVAQAPRGSVGGTVTLALAPVPRARATLVGEAYFAETRTDAAGAFVFTAVPDGAYQLGVSAPGLEYRELDVRVAADNQSHSFPMTTQTHPGRWDVIGDTGEEEFGGTNSGVLLPDGRLVFCHNTVEPVLFYPLTGANPVLEQPPSLKNTPNSVQGCHHLTHLPDGRIIYVGGGTLNANGDFAPPARAINVVKTFDPFTLSWQVLAPLNEVRWYPGLARFETGDLLAFGGGQQTGAFNVPLDDPSLRTNKSEIFSVQTQRWTPTGELRERGGFGPAVLLYNGEVFLSWYPPQLYTRQTGTWRNTAPFLQRNRGTGPNEEVEGSGQPPAFYDHPDHSVVLMPDGRAHAIGIWANALGPGGSMVEIFDPRAGSWSLGASPPITRSFAEVLLLPDKRVLVAGGRVRPGALDREPSLRRNEWGFTNMAEIYDPAAPTPWRRMAPMKVPREYHAITILLPDGRVLVQGGTWKPGVNPRKTDGASNEIEAFSPPYLFRGPRPRIDALSSADLSNGASFTLDVSFTSQVTAVRLIGVNSVTHFLDGGVPRLLDLPFTQSGSRITAQIPADPVMAMAGYYLLFAMVDDIPSAGKIVRVRPAGSAPGLPRAITPEGVVNSASYMMSTLAPGEVVSLFGSGLGPATPATLELDTSGGVSRELAGTQVLFDDVPAPLLYAQANLVNAIVPYAMAGRRFMRVRVVYRGTVTNELVLPGAATAPALFTHDASGRGPGAIVNQDGTINSAERPAPRGSIVSLYATGEGETTPAGIDGQVAGNNPPRPRLPVTVLIGGAPAEVLYAGGAPGIVAGVIQVNARLPQSIAPGRAVPVLITAGSATSQPGVTISVQ